MGIAPSSKILINSYKPCLLLLYQRRWYFQRVEVSTSKANNTPFLPHLMRIDQATGKEKKQGDRKKSLKRKKLYPSSRDI